MLQERHEELVRKELHTLIEDFKIIGDLIGMPKDLDERYIFINKDDMADLVFELYTIILREVKKHGGHL